VKPNPEGVGLSCTAVGMRTLSDVLNIANELRVPLELSYLELAVGVTCHVDDTYDDWSLVLHDSCLSGGPTHRPLRYRFDLLDPASWQPYRKFIARHQVLAMSAHAPLRSRINAADFERMVARCSEWLEVPVMVEVMPEPQRWCSSLDSLANVPLLLDFSHVHIWSKGNGSETQRLTEQILNRSNVAGLHLSHNDGRHDSHELIPENVWFANHLDGWLSGRLTTFESLPTVFKEYERLDHAPNRWRRHKQEISARQI
jgi:hypothetical protein